MRPLFAALLIILLAGCGQVDKAPAAATAKPPESQPATKPASLPVKPAAPDHTASADKKPADEAAPTPAEDPGKDAPKKTYYMNKNYFIKPIDPDGNTHVVLLSFDDGPKDKAMIEPMLKTLDKHKAKAIFFVNGYRVKEHPELLKLIADAGQPVGNHSWDHINLSKETNDSIDSQVGRVSDIVEQTVGQKPQFFRPPFGAGNDHLRQYVKDHGMLYMTWSNGSLDWADNQHKPDGVIKSVLEQLHPGSIILMHELPWTVEALDKLLTTLEDKGYSFVDPSSIELTARDK